MGRGFCGIGIYNCLKEQNIGTLFRSAHCPGAQFIYTIGRKYDRQASDTTKAWKNIPLFHYPTMDEFNQSLPYGAKLVGVELDDRSTPLDAYVHPEKAVYLLGSERMGLNQRDRDRCQDIVEVPGASYCLNVSTAGSIVLWHRKMQFGI